MTARETGTTATMTTTEPEPSSGVPVRYRIAIAVCVLVALALAGAGFLLWAIGAARIDERIAEDAEQEMLELKGFQQDGVDPATGEGFGSVERLLRVYLVRNVPAASELMAGYWEGRIRVASASDRGDVVTDPRLVTAVEERVDRGGSTRVRTDWGEVHLDVLPLQDGSTEGAFVVAFFVDDEKRDLRDMLRTYAVAAGVALVLVTAVAAWQAGRLLAPVRQLREAAEEISETDLSRRIPERGNDDLTDLTRTVNAMLARLERAFAGQRAFLDDAGHELRTPLTILRGNLELLDSGDPDEVGRTRDLLLDEVDRMSRLVDDLILLTKADRPGFCRLAEVHVADLTESVTGKARGLGDRRWVVSGAADVVAELDEQRITQALVQLAQNAVRHTGPGDEITLGSAQTDGQLRFWVEDGGPGVPDADKTRIFERFARGDVPRAQRPEDEGFGLGLSIVAAIAQAHGGRVWVEDARPGATPPGARFVVEIPHLRKEP